MSDGVLDEVFCCDALRGVVAEIPEPAAPTIYRADDGAMVMVVGLAQTEEGIGYLEQAIEYCPYCGTKLQDAKSLVGKVSH
jgi:hypothetical protein